MANYVCDECGIMLDAVDQGQEEQCPRCDRPMRINTGSVVKNFGGAGIATEGAQMRGKGQ